MPTIVTYSSYERVLAAYPRRIVSAPFPDRCCPSATGQVGRLQEEQGWPFVYHRCAVCGFAVRRFASRDDVLEKMRNWKQACQTLSAPNAA
jgi:hypothetical protein